MQNMITIYWVDPPLPVTVTTGTMFKFVMGSQLKPSQLASWGGVGNCHPKYIVFIRVFLGRFLCSNKISKNRNLSEVTSIFCEAHPSRKLHWSEARCEFYKGGRILWKEVVVFPFCGCLFKLWMMILIVYGCSTQPPPNVPLSDS